MATNIKTPYILFNDLDGQPLENGKIYIGSAGLDPATNAITVYSDASLSTTVSQPISTTAGFPYVSGSPVRLYVAETDWSLRVSNTNNTTVHEDLNAGSNQLQLGSIVQDSSGNVGLGTTSPDQKLHLHADGANSVLIKCTNGTTGETGTDGILFGVDGSGDFTLSNRESSNIKFSIGSEAARIDSSQNLLVGKTTSGSGGLGAEVRSTGVVTSTTDGTACIIANRTGSDGTLVVFQQAGLQEGNISVNGSRIEINGSSELALQTGGTERARIDSSGNVGIGTSSPDQALHVASDRIKIGSLTIATDRQAGIIPSAGNQVQLIQNLGTGGNLISVKGAFSGQDVAFQDTTVSSGTSTSIDYGDISFFVSSADGGSLFIKRDAGSGAIDCNIVAYF